jgi:hypothetical protein
VHQVRFHHDRTYSENQSLPFIAPPMYPKGRFHHKWAHDGFFGDLSTVVRRGKPSERRQPSQTAISP